MLEVSASASSAVALTGAVMPAVNSAKSGEGAQAVDFTAVLSGVALATAAPSTLEADAGEAEQPVAAQPLTLPPPPMPPGKIGNQTGKPLPPGKLPASRKLATETDAAADKPVDETAERDATVAAGSDDATIPAPAPIATPSVAAPAVAQTTAQALLSQERRTNPPLPAQTPVPSRSAQAAAPAVATKPTAAARPAVSTLAIVANTPALVVEQPAANSDGRQPAILLATSEDATPAPATLADPKASSAIHHDAARERVVADVSAASTPHIAPNRTIVQPIAVADETLVTGQGLVTIRTAQLLKPAVTILPADDTGSPQAAAVRIATASLVAAQMPVAFPLSRPVAAVITGTPAPDMVAQQPVNDANEFPAAPSSAASLANDGAALPAPMEHKSTHSVAMVTADALTSAPRAEIAAAPADLRPAQAAPQTAAMQPATPQTQDLAALVDRIAEARAAAAPHAVRASVTHEDFGSVSLNFRAEDSHIHVTLGSADPGFAPAVHAAAAATLTGNDSDRRESGQSQHQQHTQAQGTAQDAGATNNAPQQQTPRERTGTAERLARDNALSRRPAGATDTPSDPASSGRSGIYA